MGFVFNSTIFITSLWERLLLRLAFDHHLKDRQERGVVLKNGWVLRSELWIGFDSLLHVEI